MPTTRARRLISLLTRSSGLVDHTLGQWLRGKAVKASTSVFASSISGPMLGKAAGELVANAVPGGGDGGGVGLGEDRPEYGGHVLVGLGTSANTLRAKCTQLGRTEPRSAFHLHSWRLAPPADGPNPGSHRWGPPLHRPCRVERRCAVCWRQVE